MKAGSTARIRLHPDRPAQTQPCPSPRSQTCGCGTMVHTEALLNPTTSCHSPSLSTGLQTGAAASGHGMPVFAGGFNRRVAPTFPPSTSYNATEEMMFPEASKWSFLRHSIAQWSFQLKGRAVPHTSSGWQSRVAVRELGLLDKEDHEPFDVHDLQPLLFPSPSLEAYAGAPCCSVSRAFLLRDQWILSLVLKDVVHNGPKSWVALRFFLHRNVSVRQR